jgi:hypothetical protein
MATKPAFIFEAFNQQSFQNTDSAWTNEAQAGMAFPTEVEQLLAWVKNHLVSKDGQAVAYGVFPSGSKEADAICEVVITGTGVRSKWVKMLRVRLRPRVDNALHSPDDTSNAGMREALKIFVQATVGLLKFGEVEKANMIKIYGRSQAHASFLRFLGIELENVKGKPMKASMEGRFLVVQST